MPLVNGRILLDRIQEKRVLAGAFNTTNLETTISILNAIERSGLPNFIQIAPTNAQLSGYDYIYEIVKRHADKMDVPVSLHLDHGKTQEDVKQAVRAGFTSVMIDGAAFSLKRISLSPVKLSISVNPMAYRLKRSWGDSRQRRRSRQRSRLQNGTGKGEDLCRTHRLRHAGSFYW